MIFLIVNLSDFVLLDLGLGFLMYVLILFLEFFVFAYYYCFYIRKMGSLTDDEAEIIRENIGSCIYNEEFSCAVGLFEYDSYTMKWVKVDE